MFERASSMDGLLLGRKTYDIFAGYWPSLHLSESITYPNGTLQLSYEPVGDRRGVIGSDEIYRYRYISWMADVASLIREIRTDAGLTQVELARQAGTSQSAVARYEAGSETPGLSTLERLFAACGRGVDIRAPRVAEPLKPTSIRGQIGHQATLLRKHRAKLVAIAAAHGVSDIRVFGSVARGDARPESDIDLLVNLSQDKTLLDLIGFGQEVSRLLEVPVDVATEDILKDRSRERVLAEATPL